MFPLGGLAAGPYPHVKLAKWWGGGEGRVLRPEGVTLPSVCPSREQGSLCHGLRPHPATRKALLGHGPALTVSLPVSHVLSIKFILL